jgi:hypothetical protein
VVLGRRRASGGLSIALHSRSLEGGHAPTGRPPSGADLELAVEVGPGIWTDFALQAKKFNPVTGKYDGWDPGQNAQLVRWARVNGRRAAGMLLYNSTDPPFAPPGHASPVFNMCCSDTWCHGWKWPRWARPDGRSPLAISLIVDIADPKVSSLANPTPKDIADLALPWECLFCTAVQKLALGGALGPRPEWVERIQGSPDDIDEEAIMGVSPQSANYSLVLGMSEEELAAEGDESLQ